MLRRVYAENKRITYVTDIREIKELAKAEFVKNLVEKGASLADALRELARKIRLLQKGFEGEEQ